MFQVGFYELLILAGIVMVPLLVIVFVIWVVRQK